MNVLEYLGILAICGIIVAIFIGAITSTSMMPFDWNAWLTVMGGAVIGIVVIAVIVELKNL